MSGNRFSGVSFSAPGGDSADENDVQGNVIGASALGTPLPNNAGVTIVSSDDNTIGGEAEGTGNVISGNTADGVRIISNSRDNKVQGNWIGTDESGADLGNGGSGVKINDAYQQPRRGDVRAEPRERHRPQRRQRRHRRERRRQRDRAQLAV